MALYCHGYNTNVPHRTVINNFGEIVSSHRIDDVRMTAKRSESESWEGSNTRSTNTRLAAKAPEYRIEKL